MAAERFFERALKIAHTHTHTRHGRFFMRDVRQDGTAASANGSRRHVQPRRRAIERGAEAAINAARGRHMLETDKVKDERALPPVCGVRRSTLR